MTLYLNFKFAFIIYYSFKMLKLTYQFLRWAFVPVFHGCRLKLQSSQSLPVKIYQCVVAENNENALSLIISQLLFFWKSFYWRQVNEYKQVILFFLSLWHQSLLIQKRWDDWAPPLRTMLKTIGEPQLENKQTPCLLVESSKPDWNTMLTAFTILILSKTRHHLFSSKCIWG